MAVRFLCFQLLAERILYDSEDEETCTGFLTGTDLSAGTVELLTAAHCLVPDELDFATSFQIRFGASTDTCYVQSATVTSLDNCDINPDWDPENEISTYDEAHCVAQLNSSYPNATPPLVLHPQPVPTNIPDTLSVGYFGAGVIAFPDLPVGFTLYKSSCVSELIKLDTYPDGHVAYHDGIWTNLCSTTTGQSGGPTINAATGGVFALMSIADHRLERMLTHR